jgi:hypothetical protein
VYLIRANELKTKISKWIDNEQSSLDGFVLVITDSITLIDLKKDDVTVGSHFNRQKFRLL